MTLESKIMSVLEFKVGMMRLAEAEPRSHGDKYRAWQLVHAYLDANDEARRDCSIMLREDLQQIAAGTYEPRI